MFILNSFSLLGQNKQEINWECERVLQRKMERVVFSYLIQTIPNDLKDSIVFDSRYTKKPWQKNYETTFSIEPMQGKGLGMDTENFFMVKQFHERIINHIDKKEDTILLNKLLKYYPFKNVYLIYFDCKNKDWPVLLSGTAILDYFQYNQKKDNSTYINSSSAALLRLLAFGISSRNQVKVFTKRHLRDEENKIYDWFHVDSCTLSFKYPAIVKVPKVKQSYEYNEYNGIELLFYSDTIPSKQKTKPDKVVQIDTIPRDSNIEYPPPAPPPGIEEKDLYEVKYIIYNNPQSYEETLIPRFRKLNEVEKQELLGFLESENTSIHRFFIDSKTLYEKMSPYHLLPKQ